MNLNKFYVTQRYYFSDCLHDSCPFNSRQFKRAKAYIDTQNGGTTPYLFLATTSKHRFSMLDVAGTTPNTAQRGSTLGHLALFFGNQCDGVLDFKSDEATSYTLSMVTTYQDMI